MKAKVGVLAFQGDVSEHLYIAETLKMAAIEVRGTEDLQSVTHLIIPGGESTVMARFLRLTGLDTQIVKRATEGNLAIYGTCAGAILLAKKVTGAHAVDTLGLMDITIERNAYGTQLDSFDTELKVRGISHPIKTVFIRAPIIQKTGKDVSVLAAHENHPILVRQGRFLAGTFHPEILGETKIHEYFFEKC